MGTGKLSGNEIAQLFAAVKLLLDNHGGNPEAAKQDIRETLAGNKYATELQRIFYCAVDMLVQPHTEKQKGAATHDEDGQKAE